MRTLVIPALADNCAYLLVAPHAAVAVDPPMTQPVVEDRW